jgi:hypothetical protein
MRRITPSLVALAALPLLGIALAASAATPTSASTPSASQFGRTATGSMYNLTSDRKRVSRFSLGERGSVTSISAYLDGNGSGDGASQVVRFVVYASSGGNPAALLGATEQYTLPRKARAQWVTLAVQSPLTLDPGEYHLGIHTGSRSRVGRYSAVQVSGALRENSNSFASGASSPFGSTSSGNHGLSIYATYLPVSPPPAPSAPPVIAEKPQESFGAGEVGGTWETMRADESRGTRFTLPRAGLVTALRLYADGLNAARVAGTTAQLRALLYRTSAGEPTALLGSSTAVSIAAGAAGEWRTLPLSRPVFLPAGDYFLHAHAGGATQVIRVARADSGGVHRGNDADMFGDGAEDPHGASESSGSRRHTINAVYTPAPRVGEILWASTGTWTGLPTTYAYEWRRCDAAGASCETIAGAAGATYRAASADLGGTVRVVVTASNPGGSASATSAPTLPVQEGALLPPVSTALPTISGTTQVGQTLTASTGTWSGSPTSYLFQWHRCDSSGVTCVAIAGATATSYALVSRDADGRMRVSVTAANAVGSTTALSQPSAVVEPEAAAPPAPLSPPPPSPSPPGSDLANLWLHSQQGGSCTRSATPAAYNAATACASAGAAYSAANAVDDASLILVKGGPHGVFHISGHRRSSNRIVFDAAPGERPVFSGGWMRAGTYDMPSASPKYVTLRNLETAERGSGETPDNRFGVKIEKGSQHIRLENLRAGNFLIQAAQNIEVIGGEYGPCRASKVDPPICEINKVDGWVGTRAENILIDGVLMHGFDYAPSCALAGDCHYRAMYMNGVKNFTLRNSTIRDSVFAPWFTISGADAARWGNENILIENNVFGSQVVFNQTTGARSYSGNGLGFQLRWCTNASAGVMGYRNVTIRFNSVSRGATIDTSTMADSNCRFENVQVYGNVAGVRNSPCVPGIVYRYNVYSSVSPGGVCDSTEVSTGSVGLPFYAEDVHTPGPASYRLMGPSAPPDNLVPASLGCPDTDRFGSPRSGPSCDAGSHER